jgi:hypothetical protein
MLTNKRGTMLRVCDAARSGLAVPRLKNIVASPSRAVAAQPQATRDSIRSRCGQISSVETVEFLDKTRTNQA